MADEPTCPWVVLAVACVSEKVCDRQQVAAEYFAIAFWTLPRSRCSEDRCAPDESQPGSSERNFVFGD